MYYIDNETRGAKLLNTITAERQEEKTMKTFYSVELEANCYMDDIINGTLEE